MNMLPVHLSLKHFRQTEGVRVGNFPRSQISAVLELVHLLSKQVMF